MLTIPSLETETCAVLLSDSKVEKVALPDLLTHVQDHKSSLEGFASRCRAEPSFMARAVNSQFLSRPEVVRKKYGLSLPVCLDRYKSIAFIQVALNANLVVAVWGWVSDILRALIEDQGNSVYEATLLQELTKVCHFEISRTGMLLRRHVAVSSGSEYFWCTSGAAVDGVTMKIKPSLLATSNSKMHYLLRLCDSQTTVAQSRECILGLNQLHGGEPLEEDSFTFAECNALGALSFTTGFVYSLSSSICLPREHNRKGQRYLSRLKALTRKMDAIEAELDLQEYVVPVCNLLNSDVAGNAWKSLDNFILEKTGKDLENHYRELAEATLHSMKHACERRAINAYKLTPSYLPVPETRPRNPSREQRLEARRPPNPALPARIRKVKQTTFHVFETVFSRAESQGSVSWASFQSAMVDVGFAVIPKTGSIFTFVPPKGLGAQRPFIVHRPHRSRIEGVYVLRFAKRLKTLYGWDKDMFEAARADK